MLDLIVAQMLDIRIIFRAHRGTDKNCKNVFPDCRVRSWVMRKEHLESAGDTLPNDQLVFGVSIALEVVYGLLERNPINIAQGLFECLDALNKVIGQDRMSDWSGAKV